MKGPSLNCAQPPPYDIHSCSDCPLPGADFGSLSSRSRRKRLMRREKAVIVATLRETTVQPALLTLSRRWRVSVFRRWNCVPPGV
jgi:hypothetical protein